MFAKEVSVDYRGDRIVVQNSWGGGAIAALLREGIGAARRALGDETRLLINGKIVTSTDTWIISPRSIILLQSSVDNAKGSYIVTVYAKAGFLKNLLKICVGDERIAGDF